MAASLGNPSFGLDYRWHMEAAQRLLDTGTPYLPVRAGRPVRHRGRGDPLPADGVPPVHPLPVAARDPVVGDPDRDPRRTGSWWHHPPLWAWVVITSILAFDKSLNVYVFGNPVDVDRGGRSRPGPIWRWPFVFVLAKPTFTPIACSASVARSWWVALAALGGRVAAVPAGLDRLVHGRAQLGRVAAVQPADAAAHAGPARRVARARSGGQAGSRLAVLTRRGAGADTVVAAIASIATDPTMPERARRPAAARRSAASAGRPRAGSA